MISDPDSSEMEEMDSDANSFQRNFDKYFEEDDNFGAPPEPKTAKSKPKYIFYFNFLLLKP